MVQRLYIRVLYKIVLTVLLNGACAVWGQQSFCVGSIKHFAVDHTENNGNGTPGSIYTWQVTSGPFTGSITPLTPSGNQVEINWGTSPIGDYILKVTETNNGCRNTQELMVSLRNEVELDELEDLLICPEGGSVTFNAGFGYESYSWYDQNGELIGNTRLMTVNEPGTYLLEVSQNGCIATQTVEAIPIVFPAYTATSDAFNTIVINSLGGNVENVEFQLEDLDGKVIKPWQVGNTFYGVPEGIYIVRIRTWDTSCYTYLYATTLSIPNLITPNGDGYNDIWDLSRLMNYAPEARIEVFDRYGKLLKIITAVNQFKWDGKYQSKPLPTDSYIYFIHIGNNKITGNLLIKNY